MNASVTWEAGALEVQRFRKTGQIVSLSEWNPLDYSWSQGSEGCHVGLMNYAFQYILNNGDLDSEESYPYRPGDRPCTYRPGHPAASATGPVSMPPQEESLVLVVAAVGPVPAALRASLDTFRFYFLGIYCAPNRSSEELNHGVLLFVYGSEGEESGNQNYWIIKNSWGTDWGTQGSMLMAKALDNQCRMATVASYVGAFNQLSTSRNAKWNLC
ncbi:procathepsin L-like [Neovison vison]|uniref:procathepsin L-like n=1 Tax=Neovison vison TaxID=452646 RepID=UPI001CF07FB1|nr:procathepsin L-like [Neogale vison]